MSEKIWTIGFTGTRHGLTPRQHARLKAWLVGFVSPPGGQFNFHHGDCVGADKEFHDLLCEMGYQESIIVHPPWNDKLRAYCLAPIILPTLPYLERNKEIVDSVEILLGCPREEKSQLRSGTWSTLRYAEEEGDKVLRIFTPSGGVRFKVV